MAHPNSTAVDTFNLFTPTPKEEEADLWKSVLIESLRQGRSASMAIREAHQCIAGMRERFPVQNETHSDSDSENENERLTRRIITMGMGTDWAKAHGELPLPRLADRAMCDCAARARDHRTPFDVQLNPGINQGG